MTFRFRNGASRAAIIGLSTVSLCAFAAPANAEGGRGGGLAGGTGGADSETGAGSNGSTASFFPPSSSGAGGGGAGVTGGNGGGGANNQAAGGLGGQSAGQSGADGADGGNTPAKVQAGGGGGGGAHGYVGTTLPIGAVSGGNGGNGGNVIGTQTVLPYAGGGGAGGYGAVVNASGDLGTLNVAISGGQGGHGGETQGGGNQGANGGTGGIGLDFIGSPAVSPSLAINAAVTGGHGGTGGNSNITAGDGADGGVGVMASSFANLTINGSVTGGNGGAAGVGVNGGNGGSGGWGVFGNLAINAVVTVNGSVKGGDGGNGNFGSGADTTANGNGARAMYLSSVGGGQGLTLTVTGSVTGGNAGSGAKIAGTGGTGILIGAGNASVINSGSIAGGFNSDGVTRAAAISFSGNSTLELRAGSTILGIVSAPSAFDTFRLGGTTNSTFDVSTLVTQYQGFEAFEKVGASTWTLTNSTAAVTPWTITAGTLLVTADAALGAASSALTLNGGTLRTSSSFNTTRNVNLAAPSAINVDSGTTFGISGQITGIGGLTKLGAGTLTLTGTSNNYTDTTNVNAGTLKGGATNAFSAASITRINSGGTLDLGGFAQTINTTLLYGGTLTNGSLTGEVSSGGGSIGGLSGSMSLSANTNITTLFGTNTFTGATTVNSSIGWLEAGATNTFSAASALTIYSGGRVSFNGFAQTINVVTLAGGAIGDGALTGAIVSTGGTIINLGGTASLTANSGLTYLLPDGGGHNTYTGATTVNFGAELQATDTNAFSANSATTINTRGLLNLNGFAQTINSVTLNGGTLTNGALTGSVTSNGGRLDGLGGSMDLTVAGGVTNITAVNTYTGATTVNGGLLSVNGSIVSDVTVNAGGTLGGNGTVGNTTINGGALAPGNSIGTLVVVGNLVFTAAASYMVEVSPTDADRTIVTGAATLGGATVNASFASGAYVARQYTIIDAAAVNGTFSSVVNTNLPSNFKTTLSYDATHAYLDLALTFVPPQGGGLSRNQQNVGNTIIDYFNNNGSIPLVFGVLTPSGLSQVSGEGATGSQQTTFNAMNLFMGVLTDPFIAGRGDPIAAGGKPSAYADETLAYAARSNGRSRSERDAYAAMSTKAPPIAPSFEQRWSVWAAAFGGSQQTDGNAALGSNNASSSIYGTAVGADYRFSPNTIAGFALAGGGTNFTVANTLGGGRSDLFQAGAFVRHTIGAAYLTGALAYGWQDITTDRTVTVAGIDRLRAQFNANAWSGRVEGGYRFVTGGFGLTPYAAGQFTTFVLPGYAEQAIVGSNNFALAYNAKSVTDTRSELGLRSDRSFAMRDGVLTLRGRAAWAHDFNPDRAIAATFQTLPGASFVVNGAAMASDSALVTGSAEMKWLNGWSAAATFEGEFSNVTRSYAGKGVVRYAW